MAATCRLGLLGLSVTPDSRSCCDSHGQRLPDRWPFLASQTVNLNPIDGYPLSAKVGETGTGNLSVPQLPVRGRDQIAQLAGSFSRMTPAW